MDMQRNPCEVHTTSLVKVIPSLTICADMACFLYPGFLWVVRVLPNPTCVLYPALAVNGIAWSLGIWL